MPTLEFESLATQTETLIDICKRLRQENQLLQQKYQHLAQQNSQLQNKHQQAVRKVKHLISHLKTLENAS